MSSTYSPDLRIELIGTGDQAGVWGATTNNNLADVIEQSVAGYISVAVASANPALTYINGGTSVAADNQSVHASLALTTSTGANFAVYAPPASKQYTIYNASSYVATIYNSTVIGNTTAAGTGVAIPAGKTMTVWSDGTNFAQQNTHLISPTMASPAMSGTPTAPTAAYGTDTTQVSTTAFVQAALQALYPIGSIYSSTVSTNPGTLFGFGTWVAYAAGRVMVGNGGGFTAGDTGGSADAIAVTHTHTASSGNQSADHTHSFSATTDTASLTGTFPTSAGANSYSGVFTRGSGYSGNGGEPQTNYPVNMDASHSHTVSGTTGTQSANHNHAITVDSAGSSGTGANLQPYVVVYMWNRTA
jgi:hypothetical protein